MLVIFTQFLINGNLKQLRKIYKLNEYIMGLNEYKNRPTMISEFLKRII